MMHEDDLTWIGNGHLLKEKFAPDYFTFHDSEVLEFHYWCGEIDPEKNRWIMPSLTCIVKVFPWVGKEHFHCRARLLFEDVRDFKMEGLSHQNPIDGLDVRPYPSAGTPILQVEFQPVSSFSMSFLCASAHLLELTDLPEKEEAVLLRTGG